MLLSAFTVLMVGVIAFVICLGVLGYYEQTRGDNPQVKMIRISMAIAACVVAFYLT